MKKKYTVAVREVHIAYHEVEAENEEAAKKKLANNYGDTSDIGFEYSHTLDPEFWTVEEGWY